MAAYLEYIQVLRETFEVFELAHLPREQNAQADLLAKLARSGKGGQTEDSHAGDSEDTSNCHK